MQFIHEYSLDEIEQELQRKGSITIFDENPQRWFMLTITPSGYRCDFYRAQRHKGTQYGATLTELLLRRVFGRGIIGVRVIEAQETHQPSSS